VTTNVKEIDDNFSDNGHRGDRRRIYSLASQLYTLLSVCDLSQERNRADARGIVILRRLFGLGDHHITFNVFWSRCRRNALLQSMQKIVNCVLHGLEKKIQVFTPGVFGYLLFNLAASIVVR
jgi:hypothetical protein